MMIFHGYVSMVKVISEQILRIQSINVAIGKGMNKIMRVMGKEIKDECSHCGDILECELFKQGHGIHCERENITMMIECQMKHRKRREENERVESVE